MIRRRLILGFVLSLLAPCAAAAEIPVESQYPTLEALETRLKQIGEGSIFLALVRKFSDRETLVLYMASPWEGTFARTAYIFAQILKPSGRTFVLDKGVIDRTPEHTSLSRFRYDPQTGVVRYFDDYGKMLAAKSVTLR